MFASVVLVTRVLGKAGWLNWERWATAQQPWNHGRTKSSTFASTQHRSIKMFLQGHFLLYVDLCCVKGRKRWRGVLQKHQFTFGTFHRLTGSMVTRDSIMTWYNRGILEKVIDVIA